VRLRETMHSAKRAEPSAVCCLTWVRGGSPHPPRKTSVGPRGAGARRPLVAMLFVCVGILVGAGTRTAEAVRPEPLKDLGSKHKVRVTYFVPTDREPTANWRAKITVLMTFVADLYRQDLTRHGYETRGLDFEFDSDGLLVHLIRGKQKAAHYNGDPEFEFLSQWRTILPEVEAALGKAAQNLHVVFAETYDDGPTKFEWRGGVALGARYTSDGGAGLFSAWILRDEFCATTIDDQLRFLADETPIKGRVALGCGRMDSPRFEFIEDGFGAVAHEMGHAFGLPHDHRKDRRYVMGNGFRTLRRNYVEETPPDDRVGFSPENARILTRSRFLAKDADSSDAKAPHVELETPARLKAGAREVPVRGRATDDKGLAAVLYWWRPMDSTVGGAELAGTSADLGATLPVRPLKEGKADLVVTVIDRGGNIRTAKMTYEVE